jgi:protein Mpv17
MSAPRRAGFALALATRTHFNHIFPKNIPRSTSTRLIHSEKQGARLPQSESSKGEDSNAATIHEATASSAAIGTSSKADSAAKTIPGPAYFWLDSLSAPLRAYARAQYRRPYLTQLISTLVIYLLGDLSAQSLTPADPNEPYSPARTLRALIIGGLAAIPGYRWFLWLGTSFNYSSKVLSIAVKVGVNQVMFTPLFNSYFFGMQSALTGATPAEIWERIRNTVPTSWVNSLKLWPAVTAFSFTFVPLHFRSIFAGKY